MWEFLSNPPVYLQQAIAIGVILLFVFGGSAVVVLRFGGIGQRFRDNEKNILENKAELEAAKRELKKDFDDQIENEKKDFAKQIQSIIQNAALNQQQVQTKLDEAIKANKLQENTNLDLKTKLENADTTIQNLNKRLDDIEQEQKSLQALLAYKEQENQKLFTEHQEKDAIIMTYRNEIQKMQTTIENQVIREKALMDAFDAFGNAYKELLNAPRINKEGDN